MIWTRRTALFKDRFEQGIESTGWRLLAIIVTFLNDRVGQALWATRPNNAHHPWPQSYY